MMVENLGSSKSEDEAAASNQGLVRLKRYHDPSGALDDDEAIYNDSTSKHLCCNIRIPGWVATLAYYKSTNMISLPHANYHPTCYKYLLDLGRLNIR